MSSPASERRKCGNRGAKASISGWRAFDLKQKRKTQDIESDSNPEDYPSLFVPKTPYKDRAPLEKPFSSVVAASMNFPSLMDVTITNNNLQTQVPASTSFLGTAHYAAEASDSIEAGRKLKNLHPWAEKCLIQDVLAGVNNNLNVASSLLEAMHICENEDGKKDIDSNGNSGKNKEIESNGNDLLSTYIHGNLVVEKDCNSFARDPLDDSYKQSQRNVKSLPIISEPEWEEDDVYLVHRKDAMRKIRSASHYSKASNDAYIRGDHTAARHFSLIAQRDWNAAEKLNAKAAKEILNVRNCEKDLWTLDLHGLHEAEAVEALHDRLWTVEFLVSPELGGVQKESGMLLAPHVQTKSPFELQKVGRQPHPFRQSSTLLQVITGKGNHSRGTAALPSAIRNFLNENGYRFDETRPGVIMIRPKFRLP